MDNKSLEDLYKEFIELQEKYNKAVKSGAYDNAIDIGERLLERLLSTLKKDIRPILKSQIAMKIVDNVANYHEKNLAYVKGIKSASSKIPFIYSFEAKERALETLSTDIQALFNFILGALVISDGILHRSEKELRGYIQ